MTESYNRIIM